MKQLQEFRNNLVEEEKSNYKQFDTLVRAGLANKAQLARIHKVLDKMKEDKPVLTPSDRLIVQELLNKMVDIVTSNKQIFQQTRRAVKEDFELVEAPVDFNNDPPFVLVLKRRAIRMYPDKTKVALYYSKTLDKYFSVPYGGPMGAAIQAEETQSEEAVMDQLHKIVAGKQAQSVKFGDGSTRKVDHYTASAITQIHNALNDENKKKFADMVHKSAAHLAKASDFAFSRMK